VLVQINTSWFYVWVWLLIPRFSKIPHWGWSLVWCLTSKPWAFAAKEKLRTKWGPSWWWCRAGYRLFVSSLLYSNSSSLRVHFQWYYFFAWLFQHVSYQREILVTGFPSSQISTLCSTILEVLSMPFTGKIPPWWRSISHCAHVDVFCLQTVSKKYCSWYLSFFFLLTDVVGLTWPFIASQNLCWFGIYVTHSPKTS